MSAPTKKTTKRPKYPDEIRAAVKVAIEARGTKNGAPGAKQHVAVRAALPADATTVKQILAAVGVKNEKTLRDIANGTADRDAVKSLKDFSAKIDDPWAKGRWLAAILVARIVEAKS